MPWALISVLGAATLPRTIAMGKEYPFSESTLGDRLAAGTGLSVHPFDCQRQAVLDVAALAKRFGPDQPCLHWIC